MPNPQATGISGITGRTVYIRHASEWDRFRVRQKLRREGLSGELPAASQVVVAIEEDRIIGIGILRTTSADATACLLLLEDAGRSGIGAQVVRHLLDHSPVKTVFAKAGSGDHILGAGFVRKEKAQRFNLEEGFEPCRVLGLRRTSVDVYERAQATPSFPATGREEVSVSAGGASSAAFRRRR